MISNVEHIKVFTRVRKNIFLTLVGALNAKIERCCWLQQNLIQIAIGNQSIQTIFNPWFIVVTVVRMISDLKLITVFLD